MKATKDEASYKTQALGAKHCGACKYFQKSNSCSLVQGIIKATGVCKYYRAKGVV